MSHERYIQGFQFLRFNHAGAMQLRDGRTVNYGVIRLTENEIVYYTGKGLREIWNPNMSEQEKMFANELKKTVAEENGERRLINSGHIAVTKLDDIVRVMF